ncbi:uncharacterized protein LOC135500157 [Lineus longissimus]|uniref:uncharacterized protein LOC135500157 n=1 Tax=Lineus longissimus TaxID=88925 RepID=UPI00315D0040
MADFIPLGRLHLRPLQFYLKCFFKTHQDHIEKVVPLQPIFFQYLLWWESEDNLMAGDPLHPPEPVVTLITDASLSGWGAHLGTQTVSSQWSEQEASLHINLLELKAVLLAIKALLNQIRGKCIRILSDNTTVVSYIRRQGGTQSLSLYLLTRELFLFCQEQGIFLRVAFIPGKRNVLADSLS